MREVELPLGHAILHAFLRIQFLLQLFMVLTTLKTNIKNFTIVLC